MSIADKVAADARGELLSAVAKVVYSFEQRRSESSRGAEARDEEASRVPECVVGSFPLKEEGLRHSAAEHIADFCTAGRTLDLHCTHDVRALLRSLFSDEELEKMHIALRPLVARPSRKARAQDPANSGKRADLYLIRPVTTDATLLKEHIEHDKGDYFPVLCLPDVPEMFPEVLQSVLGKGFKVDRHLGGSRSVRLFRCNVHMAPIESCALSMFLSDAFESFHGDGDPVVAWFFARAVEHLECRVLGGVVPSVTCLGHLSRFAGEALVMGRRDCAADLIILGMEKSNATSDLPFVTQQVRSSRLRSRGGDQCATASDVGIDPAALRDKRKLFGNSTMLDEAVFVDRRVDMVTPMSLNFTYEGLLDNLFGVEEGRVEVPPGVVDGTASAAGGIYDNYRNNFVGAKPPAGAADRTALALSSPLYRDIRWLNYSEVGKYLHQRALQVHKGYEHGDLSTIGEMGEFVKKFKDLQKEHSELSVHVNLMSWLTGLVNGDATQLLHQLEDCILQASPDFKLEDSKLASFTAKLFNKPCDPCVTMFLDLVFWNVDIHQVYRLLVLLSQTRDGLKGSDLQNIKRAIVDQYGFGQLVVLHRLEKMGLIRVNENPDGLRWARLCKKLNLLVDRDIGVSDYSTVFGGYAPISVRMVQLILLSHGLSTVQSELSLLNCPVSSLKQRNLLPNPAKGKASYKLFGLLGGATLGEIAAVALLNQKKSDQIVLLTTNVATVRGLIKVDV